MGTVSPCAIVSNTVNAPQFHRVFVAFLLCLHAGLLAIAAFRDSPTANEPAHLAAGLATLHLGRFDVYNVNPPLVRTIAAAAAVLAGAQVDWTRLQDETFRPEFAVGADFVHANGTRTFEIVTVARLACIWFSVVGGYICSAWARCLGGLGAGTIAAILWCFCPYLLGHGHLITSDSAGACLALAAGYSFWQWLHGPTWSRALWSGFILGLAELAKMTCALLVVAWPVVWIACRLNGHPPLGWRGWVREGAMQAARMVVCLLTVNIGFAFTGFATPFEEYRFRSSLLCPPSSASSPHGGNRFKGTMVGKWPVPLPRAYLEGFDLQIADFERTQELSYLRGTWRSRGWWYYYLYAFVVKTPIPTLLLVAFSAGSFMIGKPHVRLSDALCVIFPAILILVSVSCQTIISKHFRYALPMIPFLYVWVSCSAAHAARWSRAGAALVILLLASGAWSSLAVFPHSLSYFNELAGGPRSGGRHLLYSNIDWGQDLRELRMWLNAHQFARPVSLAYYGHFDPRDVGLDTAVPQFATHQDCDVINPGWYAVSINFLYGSPCMVYQSDGRSIVLPKNVIMAFNSLEPVGCAGHSIRIYYVATPMILP